MENTIASLVDLPKPTGRMPFHLSPDGRRLALGVQRRTEGARGPKFDEWGVPREMSGSSVVVVDTATGESMRPFPEDSVSWGAQWSPAGDRLVACVQHEGVACLGLWEVDTGEVELLRDAPVLVRFGFELPVWTPDGKGIVVPLWPAERDYREDVHGPVPKIDVRSNDPDATTEDEPTVPSWWQCDLGHVSLSTGSVKRLLQQWASGHWRIAPDGRHVACTRYVEYVASLQHCLFELFTVDIETGEERVLASDIANAFGINYAWSPDSENVAYTSSGRGQPDELFVVVADGAEEPVNLTPGTEFDLLLKYDTPRWSADSSKLYSLGSKAWWQFDLRIRPSPLRSDSRRMGYAPLGRTTDGIHHSIDAGRGPARRAAESVRPERADRPSGAGRRAEARSRYPGHVYESSLVHGGGRFLRVLLPDGGGGESSAIRATHRGWKP